MDPQSKFTLEQYFEYDKLFEFRLEYHAGRILPVEIPEHPHNLIQSNLAVEIRCRLEDEFTSLLQNHRLRPTPDHYIYADLALVSEVPVFVDERVDTLLNPKAIVEVSSPGGRTHDFVRKFELLRKMPNCVEYWLLHQEAVGAEHCTRTGPNEWLLHFIEDREAMFVLESLGIEFPLALAYRGTPYFDLPSVPRPRSWYPPLPVS